MGALWDIFQQVQIHKRKGENISLDERVEQLENDVDQLHLALQLLTQQLELTLGQDVDHDGRVG